MENKKKVTENKKKSDKDGMFPSASLRQIVHKNKKKSDPFNNGYTQ